MNCEIITCNGSLSLVQDGRNGKDYVCAPIVTQEDAARVYLDWMDNGLFRQVYPGHKPSIIEFINRTTEGYPFLGVTVAEVCQETGESSIVGIGWTNAMEEASDGPFSAEVGFGVMHYYIRRGVNRDLGKMALATLFLNRPTLTVIHSIIPEPHRVSRLFASYIGLKFCGKLRLGCHWEGENVDGAIHAVSRDESLAACGLLTHSASGTIVYSTSRSIDDGREIQLSERLGEATG